MTNKTPANGLTQWILDRVSVPVQTVFLFILLLFSFSEEDP